MVLGHKILHRWWQKQRLIDLPGAECLAHAAGENLTRASLASKIRYYSDRLLATFRRKNHVSERVVNAAPKAKPAGVAGGGD
jgi:hypothetical protein